MESDEYDILMRAIDNDDTKVINRFMAKGMHINRMCKNGMTPLGSAVQNGNLPLVKRLVDYYFQSLKNEEGKKPETLNLNTTTQKKYKNIGYFVVRREDETDLGDGPTPEGMEALEWDMEVNDPLSSSDVEVENHQRDTYKFYTNVLNDGPIKLEPPERDFGRLDRCGLTIFHHAVNSGNIELADYILTNFGRYVSVNQNDGSCCFAIHMAAENRDLEMVKWLLKKGAQVNIVTGSRSSALHIAARMSNMEIIRILIDAGADVNLTDMKERSVLTIAVRQGNKETVECLVKAGARVNHEEPSGITSLLLAVWNGYTSVARVLLENGARMIHSHHLLHLASRADRMDMVKLLLEKGAMIDAKDDQGRTPLMMACSYKNLEIVRYLISQGADVNAMSPIDGRTAMHVCVQEVREGKCVRQLIDLLIFNGADFNIFRYRSHPLLYSLFMQNHAASASLVRHGIDLADAPDRKVDTLSLAHQHGDLNLVKLLVYSGFQVSKMVWDPYRHCSSLDEPAYIFLAATKKNPLKLRELCRIVIRKRIGSDGLISRISKLPLPPLLHKYLALEIL